jgi:hypothetical protein
VKNGPARRMTRAELHSMCGGRVHPMDARRTAVGGGLEG